MTLRDDQAGAAVHRRDPTSPAHVERPASRHGGGGEGAVVPAPPLAPAEPAPETTFTGPTAHQAGAPASGVQVQEPEASQGRDQLAQALAEAEARGEPLHVSRAALHFARWQLKHNGRPEAEALLLKAVLIATKGQFATEHAEARIELAELARGDGDMTTACEHWQMAKQLFHDLNRREDTLRMADHLRLNRCPSDWILTGF